MKAISRGSEICEGAEVPKKSSLISVVVVLVVGLLSVHSAEAAAASTKPAKPTATSFTASPSTLGPTGGVVTLSAYVTNASDCEFSSNKPVSGLPTTVACSQGAVDMEATVAANFSARRSTYKFKLSVEGPGGRAEAERGPANEVVLAAGPADCGRVSPNAYLVGCDYSGKSLMGFNFSGCDLEGANFTGTNLTDSSFSGANLQGAIFTNATVTDTDLHAEYFAFVVSGGIIGVPSALPGLYSLIDGYFVGPGASLNGAALAGADLEGFDLGGTMLNGAYLQGADLENAAGSETDFNDADLDGADLSGTQFSIDSTFDDANLTDANLDGADLTGDDFDSAIWSDTTCPDGSNSDNDGDTCVNNLG
jgi:uncharacterized protein YjbI with pentapeptide repeats